jgi:hypothetical protein
MPYNERPFSGIVYKHVFPHLQFAKGRFPHNTPATKEAYHSKFRIVSWTENPVHN